MSRPASSLASSSVTTPARRHQTRQSVGARQVVLEARVVAAPAHRVDQVEAGPTTDQVHGRDAGADRGHAAMLMALRMLKAIRLASVRRRWFHVDGQIGRRCARPRRWLLPTAALGVTFGVLAAPIFGAVPALLMSAIVWSGAAQFGAVSVLAGGGGMPLAMGTGLLANARFLPMGFALAPSLSGRPLRRAATGALMVDASFALAHRGRRQVRPGDGGVVGPVPVRRLGRRYGGRGRRRHDARGPREVRSRRALPGVLPRAAAARAARLGATTRRGRSCLLWWHWS